ncbi:MAG: radical SAM protein [Planctomycetes bacterium]|nr:radical SAM protein [Planctomycetota bacterium]
MLTDADIVAARPPKPHWDPWRPYAFHVEWECAASRRVEDVATIFLVNRECPFRCTMCDLWKYTLDERVPVGAIPAQIEQALSQLSPARHVKLYNAGNFFDAQAIPPEDHPVIADLVRHFQTVIVENHPRLTDERCVRFRDLLGTRLEVALGLETIHPEILPALNKRMTVEDFDRAAGFLRDHDINVRTFVLLKPPGLNERDGIEWALRSVEHAFAAGADCCSVIPTRAGNGVMDQLQASGEFVPPTLRSLEELHERAIALNGGRVFIDLWDVEKLFECPNCGPARVERIQQMNLTQQIGPPIKCDCRSFEQ